MKKFFVSLFLLSGIVLSLNAQTIVTSDQNVSRALPTWRIAIHGGAGYRFGNIPAGIDANMRDYLKGLKWGFSYGADVTYFFGETLGAGVRFQNFHASNQAQGTFTFDDGSSRSGTMSDKQDFWFLGPVLAYRVMDANAKNAFYMSFGAGYMGYHNNGKVVDPIIMNGGTVGTMLELGYDFSLSEHLSIGAALSLFAGTLNGYNLTYNGKTSNVRLDKDSRESTTHADLTIGLRYNL